jgi:hypothetical membrane protein
MNNLRKLAGTLVLVGATQFIVGMVVAEALYSGYSVADNYISDLGVGPSALVFNSSVFLFGLLVVAAAYLIWRGVGTGVGTGVGAKIIAVLFFIAGIGVMGVGVFTEDAGAIHGVVSLIAFLFGGLSAIAAYKLEKTPLNYISIIMGLIAITAMVLFMTQNFLGLGKGGMERMVAYPMVLWAIGFGGYLIGSEDKKT